MCQKVIMGPEMNNTLRAIIHFARKLSPSDPTLPCIHLRVLVSLTNKIKPHQTLLFPQVENFTLFAQYWLVPGPASRVCL
jgi:hypothetical protein